MNDKTKATQNEFVRKSDVLDIIKKHYCDSRNIYESVLNLMPEKANLLSLSEVSISTMNYLFLREVTRKEFLSETLLSEMSMYFEKLADMIRKKDASLFLVKDIIERELSEGTYLDNIDLPIFELGLDVVLMSDEIEITGDDINTVKQFYLDLAEEILKEKENDNERE